MKIQRVIILIIALTFVVRSAFAHDFYGASVTDKEVPTAAWKAGIIGVHPIVNDLSCDSPAGIAGFTKGDIILSINSKDVKRAADLQNFKDNTLNIYILSGFSWKTLVIDKLAIETEKASKVAKDIKVTEKTIKDHNEIIDHQNYSEGRKDNSAPLVFDDAVLEKKYGKTTPAELERIRRISELNRKIDELEALKNKPEYPDSNACYANEIEKWKFKGTTMAKVLENYVTEICNMPDKTRKCVNNKIYAFGESHDTDDFRKKLEMAKKACY